MPFRAVERSFYISGTKGRYFLSLVLYRHDYSRTIQGLKENWALRVCENFHSKLSPVGTAELSPGRESRT